MTRGRAGRGECILEPLFDDTDWRVNNDSSVNMLRERAKISKQNAILAAAEKLFASQPYEEVLLEDVAAEAGVAKGTIYLYFRNKEELYLGLMGRAMEPLLQILEQCERELPKGLPRVQGMVRRMLEFFASRPAIQQALRQTSQASREARLKPLGEKLCGIVQAAIEEGIDDGAFAKTDSYVAAKLALLTVSQAASMMGARRRGQTAQQIVDSALRFIRSGLIKPGVHVRQS